MDIDFSKTLVANPVPWSDMTTSLSSEFEKLQKEVQELKKQNNQNKKKRSWKNYGNKK